MQITGMLIFLLVWLLIWWIGSMALEATGLERAKARFQALSALSGTGFTTREAESVINHPRRRTIVSWLIFFGSVGIMAFFFVVVLYIKAGLKAPSALHFIIIGLVIVILGLLVWVGLPGKLTTLILKLCHKSTLYIAEETIFQSGGYEISRYKFAGNTKTPPLTIRDLKLKERTITLLAIERDDEILSLPGDEEAVLAGDYLVIYGKESTIKELKGKRT